MKKILIINILFIFTLLSTCAQIKNDTIMVEKYNLEVTNNGMTNASFERNGWIVDINRLPVAWQNEYAPARDFYLIQKRYHENGIIESRGKILGYVKFGIWEYFDDDGNILDSKNEEEKFGEVKPRDIVTFLQKEKIINCENGENIFIQETLKTDGSFYREIMKHLNINIIIKKKLGQHQGDKLANFLSSIEEETPIWLISYFKSKTNEVIYYIDGKNINNYIIEENYSDYVM